MVVLDINKQEKLNLLNNELMLQQAIEDALTSESYKMFSDKITNEIAKNPQVLNCLNCSEKTSNEFKKSLEKQSYIEFQISINLIESVDKFDCPKGGTKCPKMITKLAAKQETYEKFREVLKQELSEARSFLKDEIKTVTGNSST